MPQPIHTLLIGVGYHSRRIYIPHFAQQNDVNLVACLDLAAEKERVVGVIEQMFGLKVSCYFTTEVIPSDRLGSNEQEQLKKIITKHKIQAVIISVEPLAHLKYARWALENSLHILLDKPISSEIDVSTDEDRARKLYNDYRELLDLYKQQSKKRRLVFSIQAQRRYHKGYQLARRKINEIANLTNCPVTFIQSFHSDGQWTFPNEFTTQTYHPYNQGYGKMSHSGYHSIDIALWLSLVSLRGDKFWDNFTLHSQFVRPTDVIAQFNEKDYRKLFPDIERQNWDLNIRGLKKNMGEVDALTNFSLKRGHDIITNISCNTLHHGFSRRGWIDSRGRDLYKGNGRVRQESHIIEQGPFQSIMINSFQSEEIQKDNKDPYSIGGEYHYEIDIFRNNIALSGLQTHERIGIQDLQTVADYGYTRGHQEDARRACIVDFYKSIEDGRPAEEQISNIIYHSLSTQILSAIYISAARDYNGESGLINREILYRDEIYG